MGNRTRVAGVMSIISGVLSILWGVGTLVSMYAMNSMLDGPLYQSAMPEGSLTIVNAFFVGTVAFFAVLGILAIVGGVLAIMRKGFGMALTGAIAGTLGFFPTGIIAVIFVCLGDDEFRAVSKLPAPASADIPPAAAPA